MAVRRIALHAQQGANFLGGEIEHLRRLHHRLREFELTRINPLEILIAASASGSAPLCRRSERFQVHIFDASYFERAHQWGLRKTRSPRKRQRPYVDHALDASVPQRRDELWNRHALIADGEDAHLLTVTPELIRGLPFLLGLRKAG